MDDAPGLVRWWRSVPPLLADGVLAGLVLAVSLVEVGRADGGADIAPGQLAVLVAMAAVLVVRRRHPLAVWLVSGGLAMTYGVATWDDPTLPYGPLVAVYTVAAWSTPRVARRCGVVTMACVVLALLVDTHDDLADWLVALLATATAWLLGHSVHVQRAYGEAMSARAADLERDRARAAERAAAEERLRLARELHDVAAHHVSVIALHAEAGQSLLPAEPARAADAFAVIGAGARDTLTELRRVVGVLRDGDALPLAPQPGLRDLPTLVAEVERAGVPVALHVEGDARPLSGAVDASAYRIVQEALTNVLRHAAAGHAEVTVTYGDGSVALAVLDDGTGPVDGAIDGHGLIGMRERVAAFGGTLTAAVRPEGGFAVSARLPA